MKTRCECGETITDQTDYLPYKAHFISDQDWFGVFDAIDQIVSEVATGRMTIDDAQTAVRRTHLTASRHMYQCGKCGRLLVVDLQRKVNIYAPTSDTDSRQILRSHNNTV
jgi:hypothetical protein